MCFELVVSTATEASEGGAQENEGMNYPVAAGTRSTCAQGVVDRSNQSLKHAEMKAGIKLVGPSRL